MNNHLIGGLPMWTIEEQEFAIAEVLCDCKSVFKQEGGPDAHQVECAYVKFCKDRYTKLQELYPHLIMA